MAIVDKQTECLRIVTIGYLKDFIGDLIKDSDGNVVHINTTAKTDFANDKYCPTYSELTGGTLIPNHIQGEDPSDDVDGIVVYPIFYNDGVSHYAENQEVNQKDLSVVYTTFDGLSVDASPTIIDACGGNSTLSYTYGINRVTKYMNAQCAITSSTSAISEVQINNIIWTTSDFGNISNSTFSVGKNGSVSANSRTTIVTGKIIVQGVEYRDSVSITQEALTGDYTYLEGRHYNGVTVMPSTTSNFGCNGGSFYVTGTGHYYDRYNWVDSCGDNYPNVYNDVEGQEDAGRVNGSFPKVMCPSGDTQHPINITSSLTISYHGMEDSADFHLVCTNRTDCHTCEAYDEYDYTSVTVSCESGTVVVPGRKLHYEPNGWDSSGNCIYTTSVTDASYSVSYGCNPNSTPRDVDTTGRGNITQASGPCCCEGTMTVTGSSWDYTQHTNVAIGSYTILEPSITNIRISEKPYWIANAQIDTSTSRIIGSINEIACEQLGRDGIVILSYVVNGTECSISFTVEQQGNPNQCPCTAFSYTVACLSDSDIITCDDDDLVINLSNVPCNGMSSQLSLDVKRKCNSPHPTDYEPYNNYSVTWSAPSGCFIELVNPTEKVLTINIPKNCTESSRSCTITATCIVGGESKTCSTTITQQAGPCEECS